MKPEKSDGDCSPFLFFCLACSLARPHTRAHAQVLKKLISFFFGAQYEATDLFIYLCEGLNNISFIIEYEKPRLSLENRVACDARLLDKTKIIATNRKTYFEVGYASKVSASKKLLEAHEKTWPVKNSIFNITYEFCKGHADWFSDIFLPEVTQIYSGYFKTL